MNLEGDITSRFEFDFAAVGHKIKAICFSTFAFITISIVVGYLLLD